MGWKLIDLRLDYQRMGIPNDSWEITDLNKDYEVIPAHRSHFMHYLLVVINDSPAAASVLSQNTSSCWGVADNDGPGELQRHLLCLIPLARQQSLVFC